MIYTNPGGCSPTAPKYKSVSVYALPVPVIVGPTTVPAGTNNVGYTTSFGNSAYVWAVSPGGTLASGQGTSGIRVNWITPGANWVSLNYTSGAGCTAATPTIRIVTVGAKLAPVIGENSTEEQDNITSFNVYPVPNDGKFKVAIDYPTEELFTISVYNMLGVKVYEMENVMVNGWTEKEIDIRPASNGLYTVAFINSGKLVVKKFLINK